MASKRQRAKRTLANTVLDTQAKVNSVDPNKGRSGNSVSADMLATNSVNSDALAPDSVTSEALGRGAVGTENLGHISEVNSDTGLDLVAAPGYVVSVRDLEVTGVISSVNQVVQTYPKLVPLFPKRHGSFTSGSWQTYQSAFANDGFEIPYATIIDGMVYLGGMASGVAGSNVTAGTVIAQIPEGYRPVRRVFAPADNNGARAVEIRPNGDVLLATSSSDANYLSLNNVNYPTPEVDALYTDIGAAGSGSSFNNSWGPHSSVGTGTLPTSAPGWYKDKYGAAYFRGMANRTGTPTANETLASLPSGYAGNGLGLSGSGELHIGATETAAFGYFGWASSTTGVSPVLRWKSGVVRASWLSLDSGPIFPGRYDDVPIDPERQALDWRRPTLQNSWVNHTPGSFPEAKYTKTPEGLVILSGFLKGGTINATIFELPVGMRPAGVLILGTPSNGARGRLQIYPDGGVRLQTGSNGWVSLDGIAFPAQQ